MATTIKLKNSVTTTNAPSSLAQGEVAINITDKKVWVGDAATTPIQLLGAGGSASFGALSCTSLTNSGLTSGRVTYATTAGLLTDSANLTFNGTTLTANTIGAFTLGGTISGGGNQINNVIIGNSNPLAGSFTTLSASGVATFSAGTVSAPALTTTGDTNTGIFFPAADTIAFTEGGVESMRIDSSGRVGIGRTPTERLQIAQDTAVEFDMFVGSTRTLTLYGDTTQTIISTVPNLTAYIRQNDTNRVTLNTSGNVVFAGNISVGGATPTTSGTGITFPATQSASSDANTLDDYEEGTWTPSVGGNATYGANNYGRYTKIGNVVTIQFRIQISSIGTGSTAVVSGLPFTSANLGAVQTGCVSYYDNIAISTTFVAFYVENNATTLQFVSKASAGTAVDNGPAIMANSTNIFGSATYRVA